jgi:hypothetical protein
LTIEELDTVGEGTTRRTEERISREEREGREGRERQRGVEDSAREGGEIWTGQTPRSLVTLIRQRIDSESEAEDQGHALSGRGAPKSKGGK